MIYYSREDVERIGTAGARREYDAITDWYKYRFLSSFWLLLEEDDLAFTPHWPTGYWESWITAWMSRQLQDADVFVDGGANVGYYSFMAATSGVKTVAFEPNPDLCDRLRRANALNRTNVSVVNKGLWSSRGQFNLSVPLHHSGGAHIDPHGTTNKTMMCEVVRYDQHMTACGKVLVKIDAEGAEPEIWKGMEKSWKNNKNTVVILEWDASRYNAQEFADSLFDNKVSLVNFDGNEEPLTKDALLALDGLHMIVIRHDRK